MALDRELSRLPSRGFEAVRCVDRDIAFGSSSELWRVGDGSSSYTTTAFCIELLGVKKEVVEVIKALTAAEGETGEDNRRKFLSGLL